MRVQWPWLLFAVALILPPLPLAASEKRYLRSRRNPTTSVRSLCQKWQNWLDLIRGGIGAYLLVELAVQLEPDAQGGGTKKLMIEGAILGTCLLFQSVRFNQGIQFVAPIFYLCGFTLILAGYLVGGFAIFTGWLFAIGGRRPGYQLPVMGLAQGIAGGLLGIDLQWILGCVLIYLPLVVGFMSRQSLSFVAREPEPIIS